MLNKRLKVKLLRSTRVLKIKATGDAARVQVENTDGQQVLEAERVLVAIGVVPNREALSLGQREGFVKIVTDEISGAILGAHLIGPEVTELLPELVLARTWELAPEEIAHSVQAHPTLSEALMEAAHEVFCHAIHA